jgi:hypothetical protein
MDTTLFKQVILWSTITLYVLGLITLCLGMFNTALMAFFPAPFLAVYYYSITR